MVAGIGRWQAGLHEVSRMRHPLRRHRSLRARAALLVALWAPAGHAFPGGAGLVGVSGDPAQGGLDCAQSGCHVNFLDDPDFATLDGPGTLLGGAMVQFSLRVTQSDNRPTCGFDVSATGGVLAAMDPDTVDETNTATGRNEVHHSAPIGACSSIAIGWTAPAVAQPTNFTLYAGSVRASSDGVASNDFAANASRIVTVLPQAPVPEELLAFGDVVTQATLPELDGARTAAVGVDGANVYVGGSDDDALVSFQRNAQSGALGFQVARVDGTGSPLVDGMRRPVDVIASASGLLYVASELDSVVTTFTRGFAGVPLFDAAGSANVSSSARSPQDLALAPDGQTLYVVGDDESSNGLAVLALDAVTGRPTGIQSFRSGSGLGHVFPDAPQSVEASPDSRFAYVGGIDPSGITTFEREPGLLTLATPVDLVRDHVDGMHTIGAPGALALSADGTSLYATDEFSDGIVAFRRDVATGRLDFVQGIRSGDLGTSFGSPTDVKVAPGGRSVYVASSTGSISVFRRLPGGFLEPVDRIADGDPGVTGLAGARAIATDATGRDVYVTSAATVAAVVRLVPEPGPECGAAAAVALLVLGAGRRRAA
jgi:6-phosphogluconolactonase (cycloisomerase 2 family)